MGLSLAAEALPRVALRTGLALGVKSSELSGSSAEEETEDLLVLCLLFVRFSLSFAEWLDFVEEVDRLAVPLRTVVVSTGEDEESTEEVISRGLEECLLRLPLAVESLVVFSLRKVPVRREGTGEIEGGEEFSPFAPVETDCVRRE